MTKKIEIGEKPVRLWEAEQPVAEPTKPPTKRLTFDLDATLHLRMKLDCTRRGVHVADEIRRMLEERWLGEA